MPVLYISRYSFDYNNFLVFKVHTGDSIRNRWSKIWRRNWCNLTLCSGQRWRNTPSHASDMNIVACCNHLCCYIAAPVGGCLLQEADPSSVELFGCLVASIPVPLYRPSFLFHCWIWQNARKLWYFSCESCSARSWFALLLVFPDNACRYWSERAWLIQLVRSLPSDHKVPGSIPGSAKIWTDL